MTSGAEDDATGTALAGEYVLGLLDPDEVALAEARLADDPVFASRIADWQARFAPMLDGAPPEQPPPAVISRLDATLFPDRARPLWQRLGLVQALIGAAAAAVLLWGALQFDLLSPDPAETPGAEPAPGLTATLSDPGGAFDISVRYVPATGLLTLVVEAGAPEPGRVFRLWLVSGDAPPLPLGVLAPEGETTIPVPEALRPGLATGALALSDDPASAVTDPVPGGPMRAVAGLATR